MPKRKIQRRARPKRTKRKRNRNVGTSQTNEPFEQDAKRRIGPFGGTGEHPRMQ
jgi:hypothetical protein